MNICVIGTGYVGLVTGTCFSEMGNTVYCVDNNTEKISKLKQGIIPIYEPGLKELVHKNYKDGRLIFTNDIVASISNSEICFIAVGTPSGSNGAADLTNYFSVLNIIAETIEKYTIIVNKSTVPVGTGDLAISLITKKLRDRNININFDVVSNPEFLKEGTAVEDFMRPDRIIIGTSNEMARKYMNELYEPFVRNQHPIIYMDIKSAEISKYAANALLATKISFMNEIAQLCDKVGGDVNNVRLGIGSDQRIGMHFLYAGAGFGGSCFPKDLKEIISLGERNGTEMNIASCVLQVNSNQKEYLMAYIQKRFGNDLSNFTFAIWGLAFKPQTDDMREAPSIVMIEKLVKQGAKIKAYDPEAIEQAKIYLSEYTDNIEFSSDMYEVLNGSDALVLMTEWRQFRQPDFKNIKSKLKSPVIFDGRNQYDHQKLMSIGIDYYCVGRNKYEK